MPDSPIIFDGHNDALMRVRHGAALLERRSTGHFDLVRALQGGMGGGMFAMFLEGPGGMYDPPVGQADALRRTVAMMGRLYAFETASQGRVKIAHKAATLRDCLERGVFAAVMHIEGAEAIDENLTALDVLYHAGLRSLGPVWSRPNIFGHGTPFRFDQSPDTGPGLTDAGKRLLQRCNERGILVDLSHLNERGFWDVAELSSAPLVATHSNAWTLCRHARNLTDKQLDAIADTGGIVGCNFAVGFIREDGRFDPDTPIDTLVRQIDYLVQRMGIAHVGFGSDFDGTDIPDPIGDAAGYAKLMDALRAAGYDEENLARLAHRNWLRVLERTWRAETI